MSAARTLPDVGAGRVLVIGDVGGHAEELWSVLVRAGMDPDTDTLPQDLSVIQVGDLIHRGPASGAVLELVEKMRTHAPERWHQLIGNHESLYLATPVFRWDECIDDTGVALLRKWCASGWMVHARAIEADEGDVLVTHAGLSVGLWEELGRPGSARTAAEALNACARTTDSPAWRPGRMLAEFDEEAPGVLWTEAGHELYAPWLARMEGGLEMPFSQIHGHSSGWHWAKNQPTGPAQVDAHLHLDRARRHVHVPVGTRWIRGIDAGLGRSAGVRWDGWELRGHVQ